MAVQDVLLEINYTLEGTADVYLNGKRMTEIKGTTKNRARYWFASRGWGWKLGENILEFRLSKDSSDFKILNGAVEYGFN